MDPPCWFCDTKYALSGGNDMDVFSVSKEVAKYGCCNIVFTGGEPLLQQDEILRVIDDLRRYVGLKNLFFEVETNGTIAPIEEMLNSIDRWIVSPKLSGSGTKNNKIKDVFFFGDLDVYLKFVIDCEGDCEEVNMWLKQKQDRLGFPFPVIEPERVLLMPQCITEQEQIKKLPLVIDFVKEHGYRVTPRLQILVWDNKRGV